MKYVLVMIACLLFLCGCGVAAGVRDGAASEVASLGLDALASRLPQDQKFDELKELVRGIPKQIPPSGGGNLPGYGFGAFLGATAVALLKGLGRKRGWWGKENGKGEPES